MKAKVISDGRILDKEEVLGVLKYAVGIKVNVMHLSHFSAQTSSGKEVSSNGT